MKKAPLAIATAITALATLASCGSDAHKTAGVDITEFPVNEVILTANRTYRVIPVEGDTVYLDQYASIHWPVELGPTDIGPLRDSLLAYCFSADSTAAKRHTTDANIDTARKAIERFLVDTSALADSTALITAVESIPAPATDGSEPMCYFNNVTATVMELDEQKATFQVTTSSYLGGAHPISAIRPFTYDFAEGRVLTVDNMFTAQGRDSIMPVIVSALARQLDVPERRLDRAGIFTSQLTYPGQPYIYNNVLYFHYNPYDIAPYSSGMIDVAVYPYEVERWFTPGISDLFDMGY